MVAVIWVVVPVVLAGVVIGQAERAVEPSPVPVWVPVTDSDPQATGPGAVLMRWEEGVPLLAPAWSGLVERVHVARGDVISTGTPIARIEGIDRVAAHTSVPFARPLTVGDRGEDVAALNELLRQWDRPAGDGDTYTAATARGVTSWADDLGAGTQVASFDPGWVVFLPIPAVEVSSIDLVVAAPAPAPGAEAIQVAPTLSATRVLSADAVAALPDAEPGSEEDRFDQAISDVEEGTEVAIGEHSLGPTDAEGAVDEIAYADLASAVSPGQSQASVLLITSLPDGAVQVPTAALATGPDGTVCVWAQPTAGADAFVADVDVHESHLGVAVVVATEPIAEVQVQPPVEARRQCRSSSTS